MFKVELLIHVGGDRNSLQLAALVLEQYEPSVHPRSIKRALARREKGGGKQHGGRAN